MEAVAALAVLLAFWSWRLRGYAQHTIIFEILTILVTGIAVFVMTTVLSGATGSKHRSLYRWSRALGILNLLIAL
jgi:hypothetical protein